MPSNKEGALALSVVPGPTEGGEVGKGQLFTDEDIAELVELGRAIKRIRTRLAAEGKIPDTNN